MVILAAVFMGYQIGRSESDNAGYQKLDIPVKKFLAEPKDGAKTVLDFPISIRLVECTADKKWYRIRVSYNMIGYCEYTGWVKVE